jgi:hypothetical protein
LISGLHNILDTLDFILPEHLELINKEPTGEIRERLHGAIDKDLERLEEDIRFIRDHKVEERG